MKKAFSVILFSLIFFSCSEKNMFIDNNAVPVIEINVSKVESNLTENLNQIFTPIEIISLETKKESLIQSVDKIEFWGNDVYILDSYGAKGVLVFSRTGRFKYKIGNAGIGPEEYLFPLDFDVDSEIIRILALGKMIYFDRNGKFIKNVRIAFNAQNFLKVSEEYDAYYGDSRDNRIIIASKDGKKISSHFPYSFRNRASTPWLMSKMDTLVFYSIPLCDTIFSVSPNAIMPHCFIDFGKAAYTYNDYSKLQGDARMDADEVVLSSNQYALRHIYKETDKYKFITFVYKRKHFGCILSKKNSSEIYYDINNCNDDIWFSRISATPRFLLENDMLAFVQDYPSEIINAKKLLKEKSKTGSITASEEKMLNDIELVCGKIDDFSNPIIVIAKPKDL